MREFRTTIVVAALSVWVSGPALAQTPPPPTKPPAQEQKPPAQTPAQPATPTPPPPKPFPEGAKIAYVDLNFVAQSSADGKAAGVKIQELQKKKTAELADKNKKLEDLRNKLQTGGTVLNEQSAAALQKDIDKLTRDIQFFQQDANAEIQQLTQELQAEFQKKLSPILEQIGQEKGLHMILEAQASGAVWADRGLDLSQEVIKRLDAGAKAPVKK
jgi:Skp family chaperone for outer membrane proteins